MPMPEALPCVSGVSEGMNLDLRPFELARLVIVEFAADDVRIHA